MLKGRDLHTEKYNSQERIGKLHKIYREKVYPKLWSDTALTQNVQEVKTMREEIEKLEFAMQMPQDTSGLKIIQPKPSPRGD